jgi:hypothetical protein
LKSYKKNEIKKILKKMFKFLKKKKKLKN